MTLAEFCIRRPVFATVLNILVVLVGFVSYQRLSVREYPNIDPPAVTVEVNYRGASAEIVESQVVKPLEESLSGIEGIDYMTSVSRSERAQITLRFKLSRDADAAAADVRDRVSRARGRLPDEIDEPVIQKVEADAQPIIFISFTSSVHSPLEISDYASRVVKDQLQTLPGIAQVLVFGERKFSMRVWLDPEKLAGFKLTAQDVEAALRRQNVEIPAGRIESFQREFTVVSETDLRTPDQFESLILRNADGYLVRLRDVGRAEVGARDERIVTRYNGQSAVALGVIKQSTANPLDVSTAVNAALPRIVQNLPAGMTVTNAYDSSIFIDRSIEAVYTTIGEAVVLVVLVIFFFLRTLRATVIPLVAIPVSLVGAFALMALFGFSVNTLTLLALVLAIGLVVDDAIVMLENIYRYIEEGMEPIAAAIKGAKEITTAVIAMTITLAAVYAPMAFSQGRTGKLFIEFALTLAGAVVVSGFVALTLTPVMCSRFLRHSEKHGALYRLIGGFLDGLDRGYRAAVAWTLRWRLVPLAAFGATLAVLVVSFGGLKQELSPVEDRGFLIGFMLAPEGATPTYIADNARGIEGILKSVPESERMFLVVGFPTATQALIFNSFKDWDSRNRKPADIAKEIQGKMFAGVPGLISFPIQPQSLGQQGLSQPIEIVLQTSGTYAELQAVVDQVLAEARKVPTITNLRTNLELSKPELKIEVNRDKVASLGIDVDVIGRTLETMLGGRVVTRYKQGGDQYDVLVQMLEDLRRTPGDLTNIYVRTPRGEMVPLSNLVTIRETLAARELNHFDKLRSVTITGGVAGAMTQGEALETMERIIRQIAPPTIQIDYGGSARELKESSNEFYLIALLAIAFIYLVLAAQFESFVDPLAIMMTVPLAMTGAVLALGWAGGTINVYSQIGLITLVGLITKHGILIVEFTKQLRAQGMALTEAIVEASALRLRPILMTTGAMVLGAVPLAIATGAGAESRQQIGWVIVGGMTLGTVLTLFVLPTIYSFLARRDKSGQPSAANTDQSIAAAAQ